jgi:phage terminase small subunit
VWRRTVRQMIAGKTWQPEFAELLGMYCELRAAFDRDPLAFSPTRTVTLRLLARDLGLSPGTLALSR